MSLRPSTRPAGCWTPKASPPPPAATSPWSPGPSSFGPIQRVGIEGTGTYGAGLARFVRAYGLEVVEVDRPHRATRRRRGKSDPVDAQAAARATLAGLLFWSSFAPYRRDRVVTGETVVEERRIERDLP